VIATDLRYEHLGCPVMWGAALIDAHEIRFVPDCVMVVEKNAEGQASWVLQIPLDAEIFVIPPTEEVPA
jgi:hypothetical protein